MLSNRIKEGVSLDQQESEYLLPHFLMLIVGKPGSGKTTMLQHLLYDEGMYN
jgi:KaiC/GvpD/RAD55 family RecA-like ATPase